MGVLSFREPSSNRLSGSVKHSDRVLGFLTLGQWTLGSRQHSDGVLGFLTLGQWTFGSRQAQ
ncbi:Hypothetical protein FKW44_020131 [Caligus rogercresseyi]|uniref:Uncharacterized protein n=1 Tax=Caligus rogercresseyi TaxID=217165 RepID=A0A7T8JYW9_CALRO|nr:Hypothetical protein FKW44_020131 [Caligus rogercresseyi]